jgi:hypothetical protein
MTTNRQLIKAARLMNIPNFHCMMRDELSKLSKDKQSANLRLPISIIVNLEDSSQRGSHWCLLFADDKQKIYYSSFGDPPPVEAIQFLKSLDDRKIMSSDTQIQSFGTSHCGELCMHILYHLNKGVNFEDIILSFTH